MTDWIGSVAKAIAALLVPFAVYAVARFAAWIGMDPPDTDLVDTAVVAIVSAVVVWWVRNRPIPVTVDPVSVPVGSPVSSRD